MPKKMLMGWDKVAGRWTKMVHGRRLTVSVRQLKALGYVPMNCPASKEASYKGANRWLHDELNFTAPRTLEGWNDWVARRTVEVWNDWTARSASRQAKSTAHWVAQFLALRLAEREAGQLSHSAYKGSRTCLEAFQDWLGPDLSTLNSDRWVAWYSHVLGRGLSYDHSKKMLSYPRAFCSWLIEQNVIERFEALHSRRYKFTNDREEVQPLTRPAVQDLLARTTGSLRLFALLGLNCGFTQVDISDLKPSEYDGTRITRRRSKTRKQKTRVVGYLLWPETRDLLDRYRRPGERLLLTENGTPWCTSQKDSIASVWRNHKIGTPFKRLRQTSGDLVRQQFDKHLADYFLGHGGSAVERAYFSRQQAELDEAILWLADTYGLGF